MKRSLLFATLASTALLASQIPESLQIPKNQEEIISSKPENSLDMKKKDNKMMRLDQHTSMFLGMGLGVTAVDIDEHMEKIGFESYGAFTLNAQVGGITMFNRYFGLEYFYNFDLMFDTSLKNAEVANRYSIVGGIASPQQTIAINNHYDILGILATLTLNANAIINFYNSEKLSVGFISGLGLGFDVSHYSGEATLPYYSIGGQHFFKTHSINSTKVFFDARANVGVRFAFLQDYTLTLNCSIAFLKNKVIPQVETKDTASFGLRFTYLLF